MKKKLFISSMMLMASNMLFAQSARGDINGAINDWIVPASAFVLVIGFIILVANNLDGLRGKNGTSKSEAWLAVGEGVAYIFIVVVAIGAIASKVSSMSFSI
ncbi:hypothetical protein [Bacteroides sp. 51]|uniref:hypothetical protein n=1 Tax=Bacteroides sp. 51 TaxID=2302938 RepID=UPI0013D3DCC4|nr:hypothetical protein [Bacteroides sp. 51]